ncbi:trypsin-like serine protease [Flavobacterium sp. Sd200]|uniref:trypsin-like serine peptidase n=1 Tax=Flavobacterium sp. Sd200 TaxID=2692211 RepID=UPI00136E6E9B|nr:serine protease [Flavobacterium sp. Sd200]MXN92877.1 trypsin-like serine protease [Flavobacterium sp. Sd200]
MSDSIIPDGLHTAISNQPATEATIIPIESPGSHGLGEVWPIEDNMQFESFPKIVLENLIEGESNFQVPDLEGLPDIGVASFGQSPIRETIIGTDERVQVTQTEKFPFRVIASLLITAADNTLYIGTGWFISPTTLVTAGHCVYIKNSGIPDRDGWVKKIQVMPGRNGKTLPFGGMTATKFWSVKGWGEKGLENYDYGAIVLPASFEADLGFMWYGVYSDEELLRSVANIEGYPSDKPAGTMWYDFRKIGSVNPDKVYYAADTSGGQSGAPVYILHENERKAVAIHTYGGNTANSGTRISSQVFANLENWKLNN